MEEKFKLLSIDLPKDKDNINEKIEYLNKNKDKVDELRVIADETEVFSLDFLKNIKHPEKIVILKVFGNYTELENIYRFKEITKFSFSVSSEQTVDLARFPKLKFLSSNRFNTMINFDKVPIEELACGGTIEKYLKFETEYLSQMKNLKVLSLYRVKGVTVEQLSVLKTLRFLQMTQCQITDFTGIEKLENLGGINAFYCRSLKSIKGLSALTKLQYVWFDACPCIEDIEEFAKVKNLIFFNMEGMRKYNWDFAKDMRSKDTLEYFGLENCGSISTIKFIDDMPKLQSLNILDTNVIDGDLKPCLRLKCVCSFNKRHYNVSEDELPNDGYYAQDRWMF